MLMTYSFKKLTLAVVSFSVLMAGCAAPAPPRTGPSMDEVYGGLNRQGQAEAVRVMKRGLAHNGQGGVTDPVFPMRRPDAIVPVWRPSYANPKTGRKEGGQWVYIVDEHSGWVQ